MGFKRPLEGLKVRIADIIISVEARGCDLSLSHNFSIYRHFLTDDDPDVRLVSYFGHSLDFPSGEEIFNADDVWAISKYNDRYIFRSGGAPPEDEVAIFNSNFTYGEIYEGFKTGSVINFNPLSYPLDQLLMINLLSRGRGLLVHACGVSEGGQGLLFAGTSQMGKSTIANLWKREKDTNILSDDRIIIRKMDNEFFIYGTPWHGDAKICSPGRAPLERIFFLRHALKNRVKKIDLIDATSRLIVCSFPTFWDKKGMAFTLRFCAELAEKVPCYELGFIPDESVLEFVKEVRL